MGDVIQAFRNWLKIRHWISLKVTYKTTEIRDYVIAAGAFKIYYVNLNLGLLVDVSIV
jgi:hypothetical protein